MVKKFVLVFNQVSIAVTPYYILSIVSWQLHIVKSILLSHLRLALYRHLLLKKDSFLLREIRYEPNCKHD